VRPVNELKARVLASPEFNVNLYAVYSRFRAMEELPILPR